MALALLLFCLAPPAAHAQAPLKQGQFVVVNTSTTVPKQLTNVTMMVKTVTIIGKASAQGADNAGTVYLGVSSTDGANLYPITAGSVHTWTPPQPMNLADLYIDVTSASDGVALFWSN